LTLDLPVIDDHLTKVAVLPEPYSQAVFRTCGRRYQGRHLLEIAGVRGEIKLHFKPLKEFYSRVPMTFPKEVKLEWLAGLFDANMIPTVDGYGIIKSSEYDFLVDIQLLLHTLGCRSTLVNGAFPFLPLKTDTKDGYTYISQHVLKIHLHYVIELVKLGMKTHVMDPPQAEIPRSDKDDVQVVTVTNNNQVEETYSMTLEGCTRIIVNGMTLCG
jgi:hypothetical protein